MVYSPELLYLIQEVHSIILAMWASNAVRSTAEKLECMCAASVVIENGKLPIARQAIKAKVPVTWFEFPRAL
jgi:hypothetical protein